MRSRLRGFVSLPLLVLAAPLLIDISNAVAQDAGLAPEAPEAVPVDAEPEVPGEAPDDQAASPTEEVPAGEGSEPEPSSIPAALETSPTPPLSENPDSQAASDQATAPPSSTRMEPKRRLYFSTRDPERPLPRHRLSVDRETKLADRPFRMAVFADAGPDLQFTGMTLGIYRAFELHLGYARDERERKTGNQVFTESSAGFGWGFSALFFSWSGVELNAGFYGIGGNQPGALFRVQVPLYARWMPVRIENTRVRVNYPWGLGLEWDGF